MSILRGRDQERGDRLQALRAGSGNGHSTRRPTNVESRCGCRAESGDPRRGADVPGPGWGGFCLAVLCGGRVFHVHRTRTHPASRVCGVGCFIPITGCTSPFSFRIRTTKACHRSQQWRVVGGICPSIRRAVHPAPVVARGKADRRLREAHQPGRSCIRVPAGTWFHTTSRPFLRVRVSRCTPHR